MADESTLSTTILDLKPSPFGDLLPPPHEADFGTPPEEPSISIRGLQIQLGDRPIARDLRRLYSLGHRQLPADLAVFDAYRIWIVSHTIGALRRQGHASIQALGYEADFETAEQVYTIDLMPQSHFSTTLGTSLSTRVDLGAEGHASLPEEVKPLLNAVEFLGGDARLELSSDVNLIGRISFSMISPIVQAVGIGSSCCEWCFHRDGKPLLGDQVMLQTILVPKFVEKLTFKIRGYALIRASWSLIPARFETDWLRVECALA